ncbi:MAG: hypothetical protein SFW35_10740 [Chitinophagales bacterium]|nr:hypothetical protein [Chitinophagales bacterium]
MTIEQIRKELASYIKHADEEKVKAIYTLLSTDMHPKIYEIDDDFANELEERKIAYQSGSAKTYSWEATKAAAVKSFKEKHQ